MTLANAAYYQQKEYCTGPFGFPMKEEVAREVDKLLAENSSDSCMDYKYKSGSDNVNQTITSERSDISVITDSSIDKTKEVVVAEGVDFSDYQKSPVVTLSHNYKLPPVGRSLWQKNVNGSWKAKTQYASRPDSHPKEAEWVPDTIFHLVKEGLMKGKSIGFLPLEGHVPTNKEINDIYGGNHVAFAYDKVKVFEYAVCTVQCNNNALVETVEKGLKAALTLFFPELKDADPEDAVKKGLVEKIEIKSFSTIQDLSDSINKRLAEFLKTQSENTKQYIDDAIAKVLGKV